MQNQYRLVSLFHKKQIHVCRTSTGLSNIFSVISDYHISSAIMQVSYLIYSAIRWVSSKIYDKHCDFDFDIVNFPFWGGDAR